MSEAHFTEEDLAATKGHESLGPVYFAARRMAEKVMEGTEVEPLKKVAKSVIDDIQRAVYDYVEWNLKSDLECNLQGYIADMVESTVKALLTGQEWAMNRYPLSQRYDASEIRAAITGHCGESVLKQRVEDLEKENARLAESLKWEREYRSSRY